MQKNSGQCEIVANKNLLGIQSCTINEYYNQQFETLTAIVLTLTTYTASIASTYFDNCTYFLPFHNSKLK